MRTLALFIAVLLVGCSQPGRTVVVYSSQDQVYAEPLLAEFTKQTGIKVLPVFDSESIKTAGLVQRLRAEKSNPRADIFWSNEEMMARELVNDGIIESNSFSRIGFRTRRLIINTNHLSAGKAPKSLRELTNAEWRGRIAMAYPVYGTTFSHMAALRKVWGEKAWSDWCKGLAANKPFVVDGNSVVVKLVGAGEAWLGLTDSDDLAAGLRNGLPIESLPLTDEFLKIPNTVGIVKGTPNTLHAMVLFSFLKSEKALGALQAVNAIENQSVQGGLDLQSYQLGDTRERLMAAFKRQ